MKTIHEIIAACGGSERIAKEAKKRKVKLSEWGVKKWPSIGIPEKHWDMIIDLCGSSIEELYRVNRATRQAEAAE